MSASESYALASILRFKADNLRKVASSIERNTTEWQVIMRKVGKYIVLASRLERAIDEANMALAGF